MAPAFVAKLHNMLSCFLVVVVVDGGSKQQGKQQCYGVHVMGGREEGANECLRSVSKPTTSHSEPQPLHHKSESLLTVRTLDHRMGAARVPTA